MQPQCSGKDILTLFDPFLALTPKKKFDFTQLGLATKHLSLLQITEQMANLKKKKKKGFGGPLFARVGIPLRIGALGTVQAEKMAVFHLKASGRPAPAPFR